MSDEICVSCNQPTAEGRHCLLGVLCPICKANLDALAEAVAEMGGFVQAPPAPAPEAPNGN